MFGIVWKVEELKQLYAECRSLRTELNVIMDMVHDPETEFEQSNVPRWLRNLRGRLSASVKATYKYRWTPATHVFVFMISPEQRKQKPCALPVQCIPCTSLKEREIRQLASELAATLFLHRDVKRICGLTRETLIAVTTNIESRECRRWDSFNAGLAPEHPRASTSDDCECFFSVMRDNIGKHFTLKEVKFKFRKVCLEFRKRIDPNLPYFLPPSLLRGVASRFWPA